MNQSIAHKGLPESKESEQAVLGSILLNEDVFPQASAVLHENDFVLEGHRRIFAAMRALAENGEKINQFTVLDHLGKSVSLATVMSLTDGMPRFSHIDSYIRIVKEKSNLRELIVVTDQIQGRAIDASEDAGSILACAEQAIMRIGDSRTTGGLQTPRQTIEAFPGGVDAFLDPSKQAPGLQTPFQRLNDLTGGFRSGELIILAARPAMGKTAMALNIATHVALGNDPHPVAVFSLEMSRSSLVTRLVCAEGRIDQHRHRGGWLNEDERRRIREAVNRVAYKSAALLIDDTAKCGLHEIGSSCRRMKAEHGLALVIIDYLQLMDTGRSENRNQEVSALSRGLKILAKDLDVPVIALSQLNRATETRTGDHRPMLSDLRDSGSIEQDADLVAFIYREEVYKPDREDLHGIAELMIAKQRNGPTGRIKLAFLSKFAKFDNLAENFPANIPPRVEDSQPWTDRAYV